MKKQLNEGGETIEQILKTTETRIEETVTPIRKSALKRFPVLFLLAVTFGFTAVVTGIERMLTEQQYLADHPLVIVAIGVVVLILTGTVYKKLG